MSLLIYENYFFHITQRSGEKAIKQRAHPMSVPIKLRVTFRTVGLQTPIGNSPFVKLDPLAPQDEMAQALGRRVTPGISGKPRKQQV